KRTLRVSAFIIFCGPFLVAQTYAGRLPDSFILCTLYLMCTGFAGAAAYLCALDSQSHNFKQRRGLSMGLTTASVGMCGVVYSQINDLLFGSDDKIAVASFENDSTYNFLIFLALSMSAGILLGSFFLGPIRDTAYLPTLEKIAEVSISGIEFLKHPIGFSLFCTLFVVLGVGYVYLANIGQILNAVSSDSNQHTRNVHITLFSLGNCASRAFFGALSDLLRNKLGIHRLWIFVFAVMAMLATLTFLVSASDITAETLVPCTIVISTAYGIVFGVAPATTTEFGTEVFARNWGWLLFAPAFGSQIFNVLFGILFGRQAELQKSHACHGSVCFKSTFRIGIVLGIGALSILSMAIYKAGLYKRRIPTIDKIN
ncbi:major facilitator superfamily domain-containing protein, partial [Mucor mucedo]|uniref:major facilitator superfamily domain-containing protein n=1 Tax=Mucor mucedo TaxID=29922 RepID=UPI00221F8884